MYFGDSTRPELLRAAAAEDRTRRFREHDERLLASHHRIYNDESALLQALREGRAELEQLFAADRQEQAPPEAGEENGAGGRDLAGAG